MRRAIHLQGVNEILEISKVTAINSDKIKMIHRDQLPDGSWLLIYSKFMIPDFSKISAMEIIREDD